MLEREWQTRVVELARMMGWAHYHTHDSRRSIKGFPDLVLVRDRVVYAELKAQKGRLSPEQKDWVQKLSGAGAEVYIWRPSDWDDVLETLKR